MQDFLTLSQSISRRDIYSTTDIDLGNRQISKIRFLEDDTWNKAYLVSNILNYQPLHFSNLNIHRVMSRIKAEEEIWNKVAVAQTRYHLGCTHIAEQYRAIFIHAKG